MGGQHISGVLHNLLSPLPLPSFALLQVTFLNITGFRDCPLGDMPMLEVLRQASERVFVPLTVGGGIRGLTADGKSYSALEVGK